MDAAILATVTSALTSIGLDCQRDAASETVQETWDDIQSLFGWTKRPTVDELAPSIARMLLDKPDLAAQAVSLLQEQSDREMRMLVGALSVQGRKVVFAHETERNDFDVNF